MGIKAIVFDIGGVLIEDPEYKEFWDGKGKDLRTLFGSGKINYESFIKDGSEVLGISLDEFKTGYEKAYSNMKPMREVLNIFENIKVDKYLFSDTNPVHLKVLRNNFSSIFEKSVKSFASCEIGFRKDHDESYEAVIKGIGVSPEEILFIDNKSKYLDRARVFGINTILYENSEKLESDLKSFGVEL